MDKQLIKTGYDEAEIILRENGYKPTKLIRVRLFEGEEVTGLGITCTSLSLDDHMKKIFQLLPSFKVNFNPNTLTIYITSKN